MDIVKTLLTNAFIRAFKYFDMILSMISQMLIIISRRKQSDNWSCLIGINYVDSPNNWHLFGCLSDAIFCANHFSRFGFEHNFVFTDVDPLLWENVPKIDKRTCSIRHRDMSQKNIIDLMNWVFLGRRDRYSSQHESTESCGEEIRLFYCACHGAQVSDDNGDEDDGKDEGLYCSDRSILSDDAIGAIIQKSLTVFPDRRLIIICDFCHSGTAADLRFRYLPDEFVWVDKAGNRHAPFNGTEPPGVAIAMSGCLPDSLSYEKLKGDGTTGGVFTAAFCHAFPSLDTPVLQGFSIILAELERSFEQTPVLTCSFPLNDKTTLRPQPTPRNTA